MDAENISGYMQPVINNEELIKVYEENIKYGVFVVPQNVKHIGFFAFENLKNLTTVIMHSEIRYIGQFAFHNCNNLTSVIGLENVINIKSLQGFVGCSKLENINMPQKLQIIGEGAFFGCSSLTKITLPQTCWGISKHAFANCENLKQVIIPSNIELIETNAFKDCKNLKIIFLDDDKLYFSDYINSLNEDSINLCYSEDIQEEYEPPKLSTTEVQRVFDDLNMKHKTIDINGNEILWIPGRVIMQDSALNNVEEVVAYSVETLQRVIKSGYRGKITHIDQQNDQTVSIDLKNIIDNSNNDNSIEATL